MNEQSLEEMFLKSDLLPPRRRELHLSVSAGTRRTPCAVVVGPRPTTCRSPPVASVATPRSARESVSRPMNVLMDKVILVLKTLHKRVQLTLESTGKNTRQGVLEDVLIALVQQHTPQAPSYGTVLQHNVMYYHWIICLS